MTDKEEIQRQFEGYISTPRLWLDSSNIQLDQYLINLNTGFIGYNFNNNPIRLGKRIERFLSHQLHSHKNITNILESTQIQKDGITLGELDFLFKNRTNQIHLEVIYKFYLYDPNPDFHEIDKWIGPNRKDSFTQKLNKLKEKQLPRLYLHESKELLEQHNFNTDKIKQYVDFRAQLFVPYLSIDDSYELINNDCIRGFYLTKNQLTLFKNCRFFIPSKVNWLSEPEENDSFISYEKFLIEIEIGLTDKRSPLCWMLDNKGKLEKFFVIWW